MDDYDAVLRFLNQYLFSHPYPKIDLLFGQFGEHRIVFNRILELAYFKIFGTINFLHLVLIGNLGWILSIYLLWRYSRYTLKFNAFMFAPVAIMMLAFSHVALMTWAMASIQQYWQLLFALMAIYYLTSQQDIKANFFLFLAVFTGAGGLALIPLFVLYYIVNKRWKQLGISTINFVGILLVYFVIFDFEKSSHNPGMFEVLSNTPKVLLMYIMLFLGNFGHTQYLAMAMGVILVVLSVYKGAYFFKKRPFLAWSILFIIGTALLAGLSRAGAGQWQALSSRYAIYSVLLASLVYLGYLDKYKKNHQIIAVAYAISAITFIFYLIFTLPLLKDRKHEAETKLLYPSPGHARGILRRAAQNHIFYGGLRVKSRNALLNLKHKKGESSYCFSIAKQITICNDKTTLFNSQKTAPKKVNILLKNKGLEIEGWVIDSHNQKDSCGVIASLNKEKQLFYLTRNWDDAWTLKDKKYIYSRLNANLDTSSLSNGEHLLELRTINSTCSGYTNSIKVPIYIQNLNLINQFPAIAGKTMGNVEVFSHKERKLKLSGWYVVKNKNASLYSTIIDIDGNKYFAQSGILRPDVADAFKNDDYKRAGFSFELNTQKLSKGKHSIRIFILSNDLAALYKTKVDLNFQIK